MCLAVPGRVLTIYAERGTTMADVDFGGARKKVCLAYLPETQVGEYVIVHVGFAIQRLDEASALETLATVSYTHLHLLYRRCERRVGSGRGHLHSQWNDTGPHHGISE